MLRFPKACPGAWMEVAVIFKYTYTYQHNDKLTENQPVAVIANFAADGRLIPVYFRYDSEDFLKYTYKIDGIKFTRDKKDCILFCCLFTNGGIQHEVILTFYYNDCIWKLES
jgi:hypothetical protein